MSGPVPCLLELIEVEAAPRPDESERPYGKRAHVDGRVGDDEQGLVVVLLHVEMRRCVVAPVHVDDHPKQG